ncbi:hypothetical protein Ddye_012470 [Dipteronia dyeriana]|uniref:Uncharacterized protein n=1 Tax=Dipteronia dyeriana TaxID=168575 RepID=A0AAE0CIP1_9ROSI|nr:hypothetical protein Ddye_012470 [Dipteronia dyeriana]
MRDAERELYPGCRQFSKLSFLAFSEGETLPTTYYEAKKVIWDLGIGYDKIHACKHDCALFWKENEFKDECPECRTPRYVYDDGRNKRVPQKVLRHFPLIPRLQRLFISKKTVMDMRWHKDKRVDDGVLRHPADSEAWKDFELEHI